MVGAGLTLGACLASSDSMRLDTGGAVILWLSIGLPIGIISAIKTGSWIERLAMGLALCLILKRREFMYVLSNRGAVRDATYYLWETRYAYYLSLGQTISAKATVAVRLFVAVALSVASLVGGGGSKPAPFDYPL